MLLDGPLRTLPDKFERILAEKGEEEYVKRLVKVFASRLAESKDLRLFRYLRLKYAGARHIEVDRLFVRELSKELPDEMQTLLLKELPKSYLREVEIWRNAPWWLRLVHTFAK
jgi:hypothetical protein